MDSEEESDFYEEVGPEEETGSSLTVKGNENFQFKPGQPFPKRVQSILDTMYRRGMTGWGAKHSAAINMTLQSTGLSLEQLKVVTACHGFIAMVGTPNIRVRNSRVKFVLTW